jgi:hypothetical protein
MKHVRFIIYHEEMGVYLGNGLGFGFWSKLDHLGLPEATVFDSTEQAREFAATWESPVPNLQYIPVATAAENYASIAEIEAAGLPGWDPTKPIIEDPRIGSEGEPS